MDENWAGKKEAEAEVERKTEKEEKAEAEAKVEKEAEVEVAEETERRWEYYWSRGMSYKLTRVFHTKIFSTWVLFAFSS